MEQGAYRPDDETHPAGRDRDRLVAGGETLPEPARSGPATDQPEHEGHVGRPSVQRPRDARRGTADPARGVVRAAGGRLLRPAAPAGRAPEGVPDLPDRHGTAADQRLPRHAPRNRHAARNPAQPSLEGNLPDGQAAGRLRGCDSDREHPDRPRPDDDPGRTRCLGGYRDADLP